VLLWISARVLGARVRSPLSSFGPFDLDFPHIDVVPDLESVLVSAFVLVSASVVVFVFVVSGLVSDIRSVFESAAVSGFATACVVFVR